MLLRGERRTTEISSSLYCWMFCLLECSFPYVTHALDFCITVVVPRPETVFLKFSGAQESIPHGRPIRQPHPYSVPSPHRLLKKEKSGNKIARENFKFLSVCKREEHTRATPPPLYKPLNTYHCACPSLYCLISRPMHTKGYRLPQTGGRYEGASIGTEV